MPIACRSEYTFVVALWCDLSLTTGYSINERESAVALLDQFPDRVRVVCPEPAHPEIFQDDRIDYIYNHQRHHPYHYVHYSIALRRKLREFAGQNGATAAIFRPGVFPIEPALAMRDKTPVILKTVKGPWPSAAKRRLVTRRIVTMGALPVYRYIAKNCLGADIESHAYARWLQSQFPLPALRVAIIPNGANTDVFRPADRMACRKKHGWERFDRIVGYVGAIDSLRCAESAFDAMRMLKDVPRLGFILVGSGPLAEPIRKEIAREGLEDRMVIPGPVPYKDVPSVIGAFDVAIDLSLVPFRIGAETVFGSFSQKIAQYLACGVPVVAWKTLDTIFLDELGLGRTAPAKDAAQLARVLRELITNSNDPIDRGRIRMFAINEISAKAIARRRMSLWDDWLQSSSSI